MQTILVSNLAYILIVRSLEHLNAISRYVLVAD